MVLKSRLLLVLISSMGILDLIDIVLPAFKLSIEPDTWSLISGSIGTILTAVAAYLCLTKYQIGRKGLDYLLMKVNYDTYKIVFIDPIHDYQSISKRIMAIISTVIIYTSYPIFDNHQLYYSGYGIANGYFL